jgi:WS/DGAT/MGAT family acyltransferase
MTTSVPVARPKPSRNRARRVPPRSGGVAAAATHTAGSTTEVATGVEPGADLAGLGARVDAPPVRQIERRAPREIGRTASEWCQSDEMSAFETVLWRADADRAMRSPLLAIEQLDSVPDWERLTQAHESLVRFAPRLRQRVVEAPLGLGTPRWSVDPHFDLRLHVWRARLPDGAGWPELLESAARLAMSAFDRTRPPWEAVLYEGLPGGKAAYLLKMHHSLTDGLGAAQLLDQLHSRDREPVRTLADPTPPSPPSSWASPLGVIAHQVRSDVSSVPALLMTAGSGALGALSNPAAALRSATRYGSSLRRMLSPLAADSSPLLAERGPAWRFAALDVPLKDLRAAARPAGGTLHDAYLASLLGGYRRYHAALGRHMESIPVAIPISVRRPGDPGGGNRITGARFSAPIGTVDPRARIEQVRQLVLAARSEPAIDSMGLVFPTLARLPGQLSTQLVCSVTKSNDLQASFVPGTRTDRYLAGAHVERVYPYAPRPGCPAMITLVTHRDMGCVGVNFDPASFTEPELFVRCLLEGFTEVLALAPGSASPTART